MTPQQLLLYSTLAGQLWWWATFVFAPARAAQKLGLLTPESMGELPQPGASTGGGPSLSQRYPGPVYLATEPDHYKDSVEAFDDEMSDHYYDLVKVFSEPVVEVTCERMAPLLPAESRILDPSSGSGHAAVELARLYPQGEIVAADLSRGMVERSQALAREADRTNMAFFQADVGEPPPEFFGYFDAIFCALSFHHYPDGEAAARGFRRVLAPGGRCFIADGGPQWYIDSAREISELADPGFIQHRTGEQFTELLLGAGFSSVYWVEALPGMGVTIASV